jgi:hypothetical protein
VRFALLGTLMLAVACSLTSQGPAQPRLGPAQTSLADDGCDTICWRSFDVMRCHRVCDDGTDSRIDPSCDVACAEAATDEVRTSCFECCERPMSFACNADRLRAARAAHPIVTTSVLAVVAVILGGGAYMTTD